MGSGPRHFSGKNALKQAKHFLLKQKPFIQRYGKDTSDSEKFVTLAKSYGIEEGYSVGEKIRQTLGSIFSFFGPNIKKSLKTEFILELMNPFLTMALKKVPNSKLEGLTKRQIQVLELVNQNIKYEEIAKRLNINISTVNKHVKAIKDNLLF